MRPYTGTDVSPLYPGDTIQSEKFAATRSRTSVAYDDLLGAVEELYDTIAERGYIPWDDTLAAYIVGDRAVAEIYAWPDEKVQVA